MATISEDYVSDETFKLLKEKGFDDSCCRFVIESDKTYYLGAPTLQMAMKWLVQEYRLYVNVAPSVEGYYWTEKWHSYVEELNKRYPFGKFVGTFNSPEQASEEAIKYCLENLI